ncbi:MAG: HRDC domain-containing protein [Verrucomicrobiota bacterium]
MKFFWIPAHEGEGAASDELSRFLGKSRVITVDRQFCLRESSPGWALCVEYLDGSSPSSSGGKPSSKSIDYRDVLDEESFRLFAALRSWRKKTAESHGIPVYSVASNEQIATMARNRMQTLAQLESVDGFGKGRIEKYGEGLIHCLKESLRNADSDSSQKEMLAS